jgi:hypothetical protein
MIMIIIIIIIIIRRRSRRQGVCMYVANGTSKITVSKPPRLIDSHLRSAICHINAPYFLMMGF